MLSNFCLRTSRCVTAELNLVNLTGILPSSSLWGDEEPAVDLVDDVVLELVPLCPLDESLQGQGEAVLTRVALAEEVCTIDVAFLLQKALGTTPSDLAKVPA